MCPADGVALGAAVASPDMAVQVIVFVAVIMHKVRDALPVGITFPPYSPGAGPQTRYRNSTLVWCGPLPRPRRRLAWSPS